MFKEIENGKKRAQNPFCLFWTRNCVGIHFYANGFSVG